MIRTSTLILMAALSLTMSAIAAQAANIQISALPFNIVAPGTYVVTANLNGSQGGIAITSQTGPVVVDLRGHTITGPGGDSGIGILVGPSSTNASSITVRNGTVQNFGNGVAVQALGNAYLSNVYVEKITFTNIPVECVLFQHVNSSTISGCIFNGTTQYGILDANSQGGNRYSNNTFDGKQLFMLLVYTGNPSVLEHCNFQALAN
jgi:hypothetical protein